MSNLLTPRNIVIAIVLAVAVIYAFVRMFGADRVAGWGEGIYKDQVQKEATE